MGRGVWKGGARRQQTAGISVTFQEPPTEYDNVQSSALAPSLEFIAPVEGTILNSRQIDIQVNASAPRGVTKVMYQIDGHAIGASTQFPFSFSYYAQTLLKGPHNLSAVAQDDAGNSAQRLDRKSTRLNSTH